jgi:hypothetical protein
MAFTDVSSDPDASADSDELVRTLHWLAESHRNHDFVTSPPPEGAAGLGLGPLRYDDFTPHQESLTYEPRSIAISPDGKAAAIGTKAGDIRLVRWNGKGWDGVETLIAGADPGPGGRAPVRALAFLGSDLLAVGWGSSEYRLFRVSDGTPIPVAGGEIEAEAPHAWFDRFNDIVSLVPPGQEPGDGMLALGVTSGHRLHVLERHDGRYRSSTSAPAAVLTRPNGRPDFWGDARLIGGGWAFDRLWLLSSRGRIVCLKRTGASAGFPFEIDTTPATHDDGYFELKPIRQPAEYKDIRVCIVGIAVRISDEITVLRFRGGANESDAPTLVPSQQWEKAGDVVDFTVGLPFFTPPGRDLIAWDAQAEPPRYKQPVTKRDPLWVVVATTRPGLRWISWVDGKDGALELPSGSIAHPPRLDSSALFVQFGWRDEGRVAFLACGLRDHRFWISPLVNRWETKRAIEAAVERLPPQALNAESDKSAGLAWWLLGNQIEADFETRPVRLPAGGEFPESLLLRMDGADLYSLLGRALHAWYRTFRRLDHLDDAASADRRLKALRKWIRLLLTRARQLEEDGLVSRLAKQAVDFLSESTVGSGQPDDLTRHAWEQVGLLAAFLRKWFVFGYTYSEKTTNLRELYRWNCDCDQRLDALHYAALLLNKRSDLLWESRPEPGASPTHWALAVAKDGAFSIHSDAHGAIHAVSGKDGRPLVWGVSEQVAAKMVKQDLETATRRDEAVPRLRLAKADAFIARYQQGPYARRLLLLSFPAAADAHDRRELHALVFCFRGRRDDVDIPGDSEKTISARRARAFVVLMRAPSEADDNGGRLDILDVASFEAPVDLYGLAHVEADQPAPGTFLILAGTSGMWPAEDGSYRPAPFVDVNLQIENERIVLFAPAPRVDMRPDGRRGRYRRPEWALRATHNPCWSLYPQREADGRLWVWAGFHDGQIQCFLHDTSKGAPRWLDGGGVNPQDDEGAPHIPRPRRAGFHAASAVWSLHIFSDRRQNPVAVGSVEQKWLLAYGTADGAIGVMELPPDAKVQQGVDSTVHFIHTQEAAPICGLVDYEEGGTVKLLAVAQNGVACIFDVGCTPRRIEKERPRFPLSGQRLDRFRLCDSVRAVARVCPPTSDPNQDTPWLVLGSSDGLVSKRVLLAAIGGRARQRLVDAVLDVLSVTLRRTPPLPGGEAPRRPVSDVGDCVGYDKVEWIYDWIRAVDVGDEHLTRVALWDELRQARRRLTRGLADVEGLRHDVGEYLAVVKRLSNEIFLRRPFSREPMKIVWDEGGVAAKELCLAAFEPWRSREERQRLYDCYFWIIRTLEDMCDRWIGFEPSIEAKVLMHVFDAVFGWMDVILIGKEEGSADERNDTRGLRRFFIHDLLQRRLSNADLIVPIEALHTINRAMLRAVVWADRKKWKFAFHRPANGAFEADPDLGLFDVMAMVGSLSARFQVGLIPSRPLFTEVSRFFGLCLLLVPDSSLLIAQVVSEHELAGLTAAIVEQARSLRARLQLEFDLWDNPRWEVAIRLFKDFLDPEKRGPDIPWKDQERAGVVARGDLTDSDFLAEQAAVYETVAELQHLRESSEIPWLRRDGRDIHYFKHTFRYLKWVSAKRAELYASSTSDKGAIEEIARQCRELLRQLRLNADLYEPHRTRYAAIFESWERGTRARAQNAIDMLNLVEGFDRHVYRPSADDLVAAATELALQTAPLSPTMAGDRSRRELIKTALGQHPLVADIYHRGAELADASQLIAILIKIAGGKTSPAGGPVKDGPLVKEVIEILENVSREWDLIPRRVPSRAPEIEKRFVPGTVAIWATILREWVKNVWRYGADRLDRGPGNPAWRMNYVVDVFDGALEWRIAGGAPFAQNLHIDHRPPSDGVFDDDHLKTLAAGLGNERARGCHVDSKASGGYGLHLVRRLAKFIGVEASLALKSVEEVAVVPATHEAPLRLSLRVAAPGTGTE